MSTNLSPYHYNVGPKLRLLRVQSFYIPVRYTTDRLSERSKRDQETHSKGAPMDSHGRKCRNDAPILNIRRMILERQDREGRGERVIDRLTADLRGAFPDMQGLSPRNLKCTSLFLPRHGLTGQLCKRCLHKFPGTTICATGSLPPRWCGQ